MVNIIFRVLVNQLMLFNIGTGTKINYTQKLTRDVRFEEWKDFSDAFSEIPRLSE